MDRLRVSSSSNLSYTDFSLGERIHVIGMSCSGKSTLARQLADLTGFALVELDALNWLPDWVGLNETDPQELERRISNATQGERFVVAGSYESYCKRVFWQRLETVVWLDLPMRTLVARMIRRSWRRWRSRELLWGTNYERFWPNLMFWRGEESLLWWIVTQYRRRRARMLSNMADREWAHIRFIRLRSQDEIRSFLDSLGPTASIA